MIMIIATRNLKLTRNVKSDCAASDIQARKSAITVKFVLKNRSKANEKHLSLTMCPSLLTWAQKVLAVAE